jgi:hypothetical protein
MMLSIAVFIFYFLATYSVAYKPPTYSDPGYITFCLVVDIMVAIDVALRFKVSILDVITGEEITDLVGIRKR